MPDKVARAHRYARDYSANGLARMLVALEDRHEQLRAKRKAVVQVGDGNTMVVRARRGSKVKGRGRVLVVFDGTSWFTRKVQTNIHRIDVDLGVDEMVYRCDHLSGPHATIDDAVTWLRQKGIVQ